MSSRAILIALLAVPLLVACQKEIADANAIRRAPYVQAGNGVMLDSACLSALGNRVVTEGKSAVQSCTVSTQSQSGSGVDTRSRLLYSASYYYYGYYFPYYGNSLCNYFWPGSNLSAQTCYSYFSYSYSSYSNYTNSSCNQCLYSYYQGCNRCYTYSSGYNPQYYGAAANH